MMTVEESERRDIVQVQPSIALRRPLSMREISDGLQFGYAHALCGHGANALYRAATTIRSLIRSVIDGLTLLLPRTLTN